MNAPNVIAVDLKTACLICTLSRRTLENYIAAKLLPARKIGRRRLILVRDLETFLRRDQPSRAVAARERTTAQPSAQVV